MKIVHGKVSPFPCTPHCCSVANKVSGTRMSFGEVVSEVEMVKGFMPPSGSGMLSEEKVPGAPMKIFGCVTEG